MITRIVSVLVAVAAAAAVAAGGPQLAAHHPLARAAAPAITRAPARYAGVVTRDLRAFDQQAHVHVNLTVRYLDWGQPLPVSLIEGNAQAGAETLAELEPRTPAGQPVSLEAITAGRYDRWLHSVGETIARSRSVVMVSFAPEANGDWYPWGDTSVSPAAYVAAWRHVHAAVSVPGARITWLWQQSPQPAGSVALSALWPGRADVNMAGLDGYLYFHPDTVQNVFGASVSEIRSFAPGMAVLISETAAGPVIGQAGAIPGMFAAVAAMHLAGLVWFDINQPGYLYHQHWALSGTASLAEFRAGADALERAR
jgi:mannan endo-1,4-beta-mannosidase